MPTQISSLHRIQTERFILESTSYVVLRRTSRVADGAGGMKRDQEEALTPQKCRVVHQIRPNTYVTENGQEAPIIKVLVGFGDLDVETKDVFTFGDKQYQVVTVQDEPLWDRKTAGAIHHG